MRSTESAAQSYGSQVFPLDPDDAPVVQRLVGEARRAELQGVLPTPAQMRSGTAALLASPISRKLDAGLAVSPDTVGGVEGEWVHPEGQPARRADSDAILMLHGGAYVRGAPALARASAGTLHLLTGMPVFTAAYRQAPEHEFPAAVDDAIAVFQALLRNHRNVFVVGESAGGGMAVAVAMHCRDLGTAGPAGIVCLSPFLDLSRTRRSWMFDESRDFITEAMSEHYISLYMGARSRSDPRASPVHGNFIGIPPILLCVGQDEVIRDDVDRLATHAQSAGVDVQVYAYGGMPHGFTKFELQASSQALKHAADWIRAR